MKKLIAALAMGVMAMGTAQASEPTAPLQTKSNWTGFYVEGGLGVTSSHVEIEDFVTLGDLSYQAHIGGGYDHMVTPNILLGVLGRISIEDVKHEIDGFTLAESDVSYMVGARAGFVPRKDWMVYALAGYRWSDLDIDEIDDEANRGGVVLGGGLEVMLTQDVFLGLEAQTTLFDSEDIEDVELESQDYSGIFRVGYKF